MHFYVLNQSGVFFATNLFTHLPMQLWTVEYRGVPALCNADAVLSILAFGVHGVVSFLT